MGRRYSKSDFYNGRFYQLGKALFKGIYKILSNNERVVYSVLKDRFELSIQSGWVDEEDNIYFYFDQESLAEECCVSLKTIQRCIQNLVQYGLIDSVQQGQNQPNRLYLVKPNCEEPEGVPEKPNCKDPGEMPIKPVNMRTGQNDLSGQVKKSFPDKSNCPMNDTEKSDTELYNTSSSSSLQNQTKEQEDLSAMILLQTEASAEDLSDRLCEQIRTILIEICLQPGKSYRVDGKSIEVSDDIQHQIAEALNPQIFMGLVRAIQNNPEPINSLKAFVFACMFNYLRGNMRLGNPVNKNNSNDFNSFIQNQYDFKQLEQEILSN